VLFLGIYDNKPAQSNLLIYVLFVCINLITTLVVKIHKMYAIYSKLKLLIIYSFFYNTLIQGY